MARKRNQGVTYTIGFCGFLFFRVDKYQNKQLLKMILVQTLQAPCTRTVNKGNRLSF